MATSELHRGRLIDHLQLVVKDLPASRRFYQAVFEVLGVPIGGEGARLLLGRRAVRVDHRLARRRRPAHRPGPPRVPGQGPSHGRTAYHAAATAAGGKDNGAPGERPYHPGYYAAFVLDPDGNNVEVVHHGPAKRSADSVRITF